MPSQQFLDHQKAVAAAMAKNPPPEFDSIQERRAHIDHMLGQRPLADGTVAQPVDAGGVPAIWVMPEALATAELAGADAPVICFFHGGGYRIGSAAGWQPFGSHLAMACGARVLLVDYRLAPEHPFPAAVDDAVSAYRWLIGEAGNTPETAGNPGADATPETAVAPEKIVLAGDSAGGGLAPATLLAIRDQNLPLPAGCVCLSPWSDLTNSGDSFTANAETDLLFSSQAAQEAADAYLGDADPAHPYASPVFGDWNGQAPLLIQAGSIEVLADDARNLAAAALQAGVEVELKIFEGMPHVWHQAYPAFPEAVEAMEDIARFVATVTNRPRYPTASKMSV